MKYFPIIAAFASSFLWSCSQHSEKAESLAVGSVSEVVDSTTLVKLSTQTFIRSANLRIKVRNVDSAVSEIENITKQLGGYAESSKLNRIVNQTFTKRVSGDSLNITNIVLPQAELILKLPNNQLDFALGEFGKFAQIVESREISCEDASAQLETNQLALRRSKKISEVAEKAKVETQLEYLENANSDLSAVEIHKLAQKISFCTVKVDLYQAETVLTEIAANYDSNNFSRPSLGVELIDALESGFDILRELILFVLKFWFFWILLFIGWIAFKKVKTSIPKA